MIVDTHLKVDHFVECLKRTKFLAIDTETNLTDKYHERFLVGVSFCTDDEDTFYIPVGHRIEQLGLFSNNDVNFADWKEAIVRAIPEEVNLIFHNAKFDLSILKRSGLNLCGQYIDDTMLMSHFLDEYPPHGLKELGKRILKMEEAPELAKQIKSLSRDYGWEAIHPMAMAIYAEQDALMTMRLFKEFYQQITGEIHEAYLAEIQFMLVLLEIEERGVLLDQDKARLRSKESLRRMAEIRQEVGFEPSRLALLRDKLYGLPPEGLGLKPSSLTPSGAIQINEAVLTKINHPVAGLVLEYRGLMKAESTWFSGFLEKVDLAGRLHPNFKQHGTLTGRLSCENPNLQQIPREGNRVKDLFIAPPGYELWEFDFSQIELRLAAVYAGEAALIEAFRDGRDIHQTVADSLGISRHAAKTLNFAILYGAGAGKIAEQLGISVGAAKNYLDNYRSEYGGLHRTAEMATRVAEANGYVKLWDGRRRHFKWPSECHKSFNSIIQGGAAAIVKRAGIELHNRYVPIVNQVHDSYWVEISPHVYGDPVGDISYAMSYWTEPKFGLEFTVDAKRLN